MKRKITVTLLVLILTFTAVGALFACDNSSVDTFTGIISKESYATANDAAKAYLETEFAGETENVVFESYEKKSDLSRKEIAELPLGDYKAEDVEKAEKGEINYSDGVATADSEGEIEVQIKAVVLVFIDGKYHHCVFITLPGEKISKSYYTSVMDLSQYDSYVYESKGNCSAHSVPSGYLDIDYTYEDKIVYTKNAVYCEIRTSGFSGVPYMEDIDMVSYALPKGDNACLIISKYKTTSSVEYTDWVCVETPGSLADYSANILIAMDQSYFIKTEQGFKVEESKYAQYLGKIYKHIFEAIDVNLDTRVKKASAEYRVKDGHISSATASFDITFTDGRDALNTSGQNSFTVSEINSAKLNVPQDVQDTAKTKK